MAFKSDGYNEQLAGEIIVLLKAVQLKGEQPVISLEDLLLADARETKTEVRLKKEVAALGGETEDRTTHDLKAFLVLKVPGVKERMGDLLKNNEGLIYSYANKKSRGAIKNYGIEKTDFFQEFFIELCANIIKYDQGRGDFARFLLPRLDSFNTHFTTHVVTQNNAGKTHHHPDRTNVIGHSNSNNGEIYGEDRFDDSKSISGSRIPRPDAILIAAEDAKKEREKVRELIEGLPSGRKKVIKARLDEPELPDGKLAEELGITDRHFSVAKGKAVRQLQKILDPNSQPQPKSKRDTVKKRDPLKPQEPGVGRE